MKTYEHVCEFCGKRYKREAGLLNHKCPQADRIEEVKTQEGRRAFEMYSRYYKQRFNKIVEIDTFIKSASYGGCFRFLDFIKEMGLVDVDVYIKIMVEKELKPEQWCNPLAYAFYIENIDKYIKPSRQIELSVNTVMDIAEMYEVEPSEFFDVISPPDMISLITSREMSPWFVLNSKKFMEFYKTVLDNHYKRKMSILIDGEHWSRKMRLYPDVRDMAKECVAELGL